MKAVLTCILFCIPFVFFAQGKEIDSLKNAIERHPDRDTLKLKMLNDLTYLYYSYDTKEGIRTADSAIFLAKELNHKKLLAGAYQNKAHNYWAQGKDTLAMQLYNEAMDIYLRQGDSVLWARTVFNTGLIFFGRSDYNASTQQYLKAYAIFEKKKDSFLMAKMLNGIGINKMYVSEFSSALEEFLKASRLFEVLDKTETVDYANIQSNIGLLYYKLENLDLALKYQLIALDLFQKLGHQESIANALTNLGNVYNVLENPRKAIDHYQQAYEIMKAIDHKRGMANALTNIGVALFSLEDYAGTIELMNQTKVVYQELGDANNLADVYSYLGQSYMGLSDRAYNQEYLERSKKNFMLSLDNAQKVGSLLNERFAWDNLAKVNTKLNDYKSAYDAVVMANKLKDSIYSQETREEIVRLEEKYEYNKKEATIRAENEKIQALALAEIDRQKTIRNASLLGGGGLLFATLGGLILYKRRRDALYQKEKAEFQAKVADTELKALRAQMNPHFIFNSLNSINSFIMKNDREAASDYLKKFATLVRMTLENSEKKEIPLKDDLGLLSTYFEIEGKRLPDKFDHAFHIDDSIDLDNTLVPPLILQPFIENSIWHGMANKKTKGTIIIEVKKKRNSLLYIVDDDGVGRNSDAKTYANTHKSMGIQIATNRIEIINSTEQSKGNVHIIDKEEGLRVEVELPLTMAF